MRVNVSLTEATVAIMHKHVAAQSHSCVVVNAASTIGDVAHDDGKGVCKSERIKFIQKMCDAQEEAICAPFDHVRDRACKHLKTLRHLQGDHRRLVLTNVMYGFMYLERVVRG